MTKQQRRSHTDTIAMNSCTATMPISSPISDNRGDGVWQTYATWMIPRSGC